MEQGRKCLWSLVHTPPRQGTAVQQSISKASTSFWSALHDFARHDRPVLAKGWDEVGPDHPFLFVRIQVPLRLCITVAFPYKHWRDAFPLLCLVGVVLHTFQRYMVSLCLASICLLLCPASSVFVHLTWLVAWLSCLPCRTWCKIIINITTYTGGNQSSQCDHSHSFVRL
jgi:hypothetical protein